MLAGHGCSSRSDCRGTASDEVCACHDLVNEDIRAKIHGILPLWDII